MQNSIHTKILVADDNKDICEMLRVFLESEGYEVLEAENGRQAVEMAKSEQPDLILMDLRMPVLNGIEAIAEIRRHTALREIPILANSADGSQGVILFLNIDELGSGQIEYIPKPINLDTLAELIRSIFSSMPAAA